MLAGLLAMLALSACSYHWDASARVKQTGRANGQGMTIKLSSQLGDHFEGKLVNGCADVSIRQSPKRPNRITITVTDAAGATIGTATSNDLAQRPFDIPLSNGALMLVTPGEACSRAVPGLLVHDGP